MQAMTRSKGARKAHSRRACKLTRAIGCSRQRTTDPVAQLSGLTNIPHDEIRALALRQCAAIVQAERACSMDGNAT